MRRRFLRAPPPEIVPRPMEDADALQAWLEGDAQAGRVLVQRHYQRILLFFFSKVRPEVARDLTQSTFETLCAKKQSFRGASSFITYLFGIARWTLVGYLRKELKQRERFDPFGDSANDPVVDRSLTSLFHQRRQEMLVVLALRRLPVDDQIILELRDYEGLTGRQVAEIYSVKRTTMTARISSARRRLAALVEEFASSTDPLDDTSSDLRSCMQRIRATFVRAQSES